MVTITQTTFVALSTNVGIDVGATETFVLVACLTHCESRTLETVFDCTPLAHTRRLVEEEIVGFIALSTLMERSAVCASFQSTQLTKRSFVVQMEIVDFCALFALCERKTVHTVRQRTLFTFRLIVDELIHLIVTEFALQIYFV
jgi:hypothetical protein